jgi:hypothetical protein
VFGGILGFYAVLRRDLIWGNFNLDFFEVLGVSPRGPTEEGGDNGVYLGEFWVMVGIFWGYSPVVWLG